MKRTSLIKSGFLIAAGALLLTGCVVREREVRYRNPPPPPPAVVVQPAPAPGPEVVVTGPPPPDVVETVTVAPGPGFVWIGGAYWWGPRGWEWRHGYWGRPPHPRAVWYGPHYEFRGGRHIWIRGGWR